MCPTPTDASDAARLVALHLDLPRRAAAMIYPRVKQHVEFDELVGLANTGLAEAAQRFDPSRGVSFQTFAWYRTQGAIYDGLRRMSQLPKRVWAKLVALRAASDYLEQRGERDAGAAARGIPEASGADALVAVRAAMAAIRTMYLTSLETMQEGGFDTPADAPLAGDHLDAKRLGAKLPAAIAVLPERERTLMTKVYWEGKTLVEAGGDLGVSKSWASRLHAQAVERLRTLVDDS
ncbi:MAG TPA: sigma-70 family RNA polymerase sigma factor [Kofleriaceae bacterium]|nr:sigma-70 family RNA polymerase sigma factor [Kofleriaceae bacterium]